jgi:hypothetical protein
LDTIYFAKVETPDNSDNTTMGTNFIFAVLLIQAYEICFKIVDFISSPGSIFCSKRCEYLRYLKSRSVGIVNKLKPMLPLIRLKSIFPVTQRKFLKMVIPNAGVDCSTTG